jgi:hypothetical protein
MCLKFGFAFFGKRIWEKAACKIFMKLSLFKANTGGYRFMVSFLKHDGALRAKRARSHVS